MKSGNDCAIRVWIKIEFPSHGEKSEVHAEQTVKRPRGRPAKLGNTAEKWLECYLSSGPRYAGNKSKPQPDTVFGDSLTAGFKSNVIWRAAEKLGVTKRQEPKTRRWVWTLPQQENVAYAARDFPEDL